MSGVHRWVQNQAFGIQTCTECTAIRARDGANDRETCREHCERQRRQLEAWEAEDRARGARKAALPA